MRLSCPNCGTEYDIPDGMVPAAGRHVQCTSCHTRWFAKAQAAKSLSEDEILARLQMRDARPPAEPFVAGSRFPAPVAVPLEPEAPVAPVAAVRPALRPIPVRPDAAQPGLVRPRETHVETTQPTTLRPAASVVPLRPLAPAKPASQPMAARPSAVAAPGPDLPLASTPPQKTATLPIAAQAPRLTLDVTAPVEAHPTEKAGGSSRGFWVGGLLAIALCVAALGIYNSRGQLAAAVPVAKPALDAYGNAVDGLRARLEDQFGPLREAAAAQR